MQQRVNSISAAQVRQHGAMEFTTPPVDLDTVRRYRLQRVRDQLKQRDIAAIVLFDQLNTRYATDVTNMQIWCMHNEVRYVFVPAQGPVVAFEYGNKIHLSDDMPTIDQVRPACPWYYMGAGHRSEEKAKAWAEEIADLCRQAVGDHKRIAIDRCGLNGVFALQNLGYSVVEGFELMEQARGIKSAGEIALMRASIEVCEQGLMFMRNALKPGMTENELWSHLQQYNIANGGEWIETRLLSSGPRTNPWFRESSMRKIEKGDMVSVDTDLIGPYGYCADISRSYICGDVAPNAAQANLSALAVEQVHHNMALLKAGLEFKDYSDRAWKIPSQYYKNRYGCIAHGVGLCDEYPAIQHFGDFEESGYHGRFEAGMVICVESYMGAEGGVDGVKLEEQVLITDTGVEKLSSLTTDLF